jgi:radical SAM protein with 4Fe4S-binding SPASM domain
MAQSKITSSPTFCSAPWTNLNIDQTGLVMPCMHSGYQLGNIKQQPIQQILIAQPMQDLRNSMAAGEWHSACAYCQQLENTTKASGRTARTCTDSTLSAINSNIDWFSLEHITVNWSNLCNLTCVYCNPETSTAWQSVKGIPINHVKNEHADLIQLAKDHSHSVRGLTLGGGEPLLQKGLVDFLQYLNPAQLQVLVTTNLSVKLENNAVYQKLRTWPNVSWMISFDNADPAKFEYVRDGASWQQFESNINTMRDDNQKIIAHPAYSVYCALDLLEYYEFCTDHNLDIFWCELTNPWDLDIRRYPSDLRQLAIQNIDAVAAAYGNTTNLAIDTLSRYRMTLLDNSYLISHDYAIDPLGFHSRTEQQLKKTQTFQQLWPNIAERFII